MFPNGKAVSHKHHLLQDQPRKESGAFTGEMLKFKTL